ncbi:hypothetical protein NEUTE1DRAFT_108961 [Neurospora tetrasperma FGSC 2508]|uniref:Uncharacterized protein n=1 Tax=Neurospora tetrasperma (strain FGSC 2508 / ATCC MYA-4615 / P0657) TaxID=510951 RepID=F8MGG3_NEUT8|nr:uncharacterized protein NEUTE1DRAFT_108961 [Neurospora tetrasperma FGSC 2508]EGO59435.1 hypothetical protein NEUTE1DRAFT_108961 [Neurospora tetrasperma FGSC 2508]EGZ73562.1 hypothetical protein NEUTE2DRAFT_127914 [Neurospora tetrasperma FGSC 2509]
MFEVNGLTEKIAPGKKRRGRRIADFSSGGSGGWSRDFPSPVMLVQQLDMGLTAEKNDFYLERCERKEGLSQYLISSIDGRGKTEGSLGKAKSHTGRRESSREGKPRATASSLPAAVFQEQWLAITGDAWKRCANMGTMNS